MAFDEFHKYTENLILAQYEVSKIIQHELTKGEVREEFVIDAIQKGFSNTINLKRGFLQIGNQQSSQLDILLLKNNAQVANLGNQTIVEPEDCLLVLEVKGNATGNDLRDYNNKIEHIKNMGADEYPLFGIFCYKIKLQERTVLRRFGFNYDRTTNSYYDEFNEERGIEGLQIEYPNIDFILSIEIDDETGITKQFYLRKDNNTNRYIKSVEYPIFKNLFRLIRSLLRTDEARKE